MNRGQFFVVFLLSFLVAVSFGLGYASGNQNTYLVEGLTKIDASFLANDWFAHQSKHHHANFCNIILFVGYLGLPTGATLVLLELLLRMVTLLCIFKVIGTLDDEHRLAIFVFVLSFLVLEETWSVCGSYIFSAVLQPSSLGSTFTMVGFLYFLRGRYLVSGLMMAFAGYMHTNFLLLGFVYLGIAHLFLGSKQFLRRSLMQFTPMLVVFCMALPYLLEFMSSENGKIARDIILFVRAPHHYVPNLVDFIPFIGWSILGCFSLKVLNGENPIHKRFVALYVSLLITVCVATLLTTVVFVPTISQLFFWRMAPFSVLLSQMLIFYFVIQRVFHSNEISWGQCFAEFALAFVILYLTRRYRVFVGFLPVVGALFLLLRPAFVKISRWMFLPQKYKQTFLQLLGIAFLLLIFAYKSNVCYQKSTFINGFPPKWEGELYKWCETTKNTSKFLVPPDLGNFRLHAERAVVVDWKSLSVHPDDVVEWYSRIQDITGVEKVADLGTAQEGYTQMDLPRLMKLIRKYSIDYAVLYRGQNETHGLPVTFENEKFVVVKLPK
ncbi:DUF6798 domain-containing protein [Candidatus Uabimicrobium amorphum]|uniref:DUF6798 domain-containing protein n=1 Tax=Uabimicrobium amorphum TaxID=2596890 RepID=A0A5S9INE4_UABAM|nr:DUF6798 domain-containing protein [Candidatus Uabimicrobium amorphum]BBM85103.1 hypothetical protein UABAM_03466 [Candidatus Uabimicrobium amorphum]